MSCLTKEKCIKALDSIEEETTFVEDYETIPFITCNYLQKEIAILRQLISEHFDLKQKLLEKELKPHEEIYREVNGNVYIVVNPYHENGRDYGYDGYIVSEKGYIYFCLALCGYSREQVIERFEKHIKENADAN